MLKKWAELPGGTQVDLAAELSALALDVVGAALFGTDLSGEAAQISRALAAGQRVAMISTFLPLSWGPRSVRAVNASAAGSAAHQTASMVLSAG